MRRFGVALALAIAAVGAARAADLPTEKEVPAPPAVNCFVSFWTWLDSTAADCPLSYAGFTVYATLDAGLGYYSQGAAWNPAVFNGTQGLISKQSNGSKWLWSPNNINQSVVGIKMSESIGYGWSIVGTVETGFNPDFGRPVRLCSARWSRTTARRSVSRTRMAIRAAAGSGITRKGSSASATRHTAR